MLSGIFLGNGGAQGKAKVLQQIKPEYGPVDKNAVDYQRERLGEAVKIFASETQRIKRELTFRAGKYSSEIIDGQIAILGDPFMAEPINQLIGFGVSAEEAVDKVCCRFVKMFLNSESELTRRHAPDIEDVRYRLLKILNGENSIALCEEDGGRILVVKELLPSHAALLGAYKIAGVVSESEDVRSHAALILSETGIPAVFGAEGATEKIKDGDEVLLQPDNPEIYVNGK